MAKSFFTPKEKKTSIGVMGSLSQTLPDEQPITAIAVVENSGKCPKNFYPILKTYDEDSDADLWRQQVVFGKKTFRYLCLSKSGDASQFKVNSISISNVGDAPPFGYSSVITTSDTQRPAWRHRQLCCSFTNDPEIIEKEPLVTDIIVCSRLKKAPDGFIYAGEMNGVMICYKVNTTQNGLKQNDANNSLISSPYLNILNSGNESRDYENCISKPVTPDPKTRAPPERPPKVTRLVNQLNNLNLQSKDKAPNKNTAFYTPVRADDDYETLDISYNLKPLRPAPPRPEAPPVPSRILQRTPSRYSSYTLSSWNALEGIGFSLNSKLFGFSNSHLVQLPSIKKRNLSDLNRQYSYNFNVERRT